MAEYQFTGSKAEYEIHVRDMLNALSIQFEENEGIFICLGIDDKGNLSTFNIKYINQIVYFTRTDHEFQAYHKQLVKISKYLLFSMYNTFCFSILHKAINVFLLIIDF